MTDYKLLTPGPLSTSENVKRAMNFDYNTWGEDYNSITQDIQQKMLDVAGVGENYTTVLMQGSGTFGVESLLINLTNEDSRILIISNGRYSERISQIADYASINHTIYQVNYDQIPDPKEIDTILSNNEEITHVFMVHNETTSGILNPLEAIGNVVKKYNKIYLVDAMSSFGGVPIDMKNVDAMISSPNKCFQGIPGFSIIIVKIDLLEIYKGNSTTFSLDLYEQYMSMHKEGKWRFTSPTHSVVAFRQALKDFFEEGGTKTRNKRYANNQKILAEGMKDLGFKTYVPEEYQSPIITTFLNPENNNYEFETIYNYIKNKGYIISSGNLIGINSFRIANIGEIYEQDMHNVIKIMNDFVEGKR